MPDYDLAKLIIQNMEVGSPSDVIFELKQLTAMSGKKFNKEIKIMQIPNVIGRPEKMKKAIKMFKKDYPRYKKSKLVNDNLDRYEPEHRQ